MTNEFLSLDELTDKHGEFLVKLARMSVEEWVNFGRRIPTPSDAPKILYKKAGAFGSYGWNGGAVDRIHTRLTDAGFETMVGMKVKWKPDGKAMLACRSFLPQPILGVGNPYRLRAGRVWQNYS